MSFWILTRLADRATVLRDFIWILNFQNLTGKIRPSHVADMVPSRIGAKMPLIESEQALINPELDRWAADAKQILAHRCFSEDQRQAIRQFLTEVGRCGGR